MRAKSVMLAAVAAMVSSGSWGDEHYFFPPPDSTLPMYADDVLWNTQQTQWITQQTQWMRLPDRGDNMNLGIFQDGGEWTVNTADPFIAGAMRKLVIDRSYEPELHALANYIKAKSFSKEYIGVSAQDLVKGWFVIAEHDDGEYLKLGDCTTCFCRWPCIRPTRRSVLRKATNKVTRRSSLSLARV